MNTKHVGNMTADVLVSCGCWVCICAFTSAAYCLQERELANGRGAVLQVKGLTETKVASAEAALAIIQQGLDNRKVRISSKLSASQACTAIKAAVWPAMCADLSLMWQMLQSMHRGSAKNSARHTSVVSYRAYLRLLLCSPCRLEQLPTMTKAVAATPCVAFWLSQHQQ